MPFYHCVQQSLSLLCFFRELKKNLDWLLFNFIFSFSLPEEYSIISRMFPFHLKNLSEYDGLYSYIEKKLEVSYCGCKASEVFSKNVVFSKQTKKQTRLLSSQYENYTIQLTIHTLFNIWYLKCQLVFFISRTNKTKKII